MANIPENTTNPILRPVTRLETTTKVFGGEYIPDDAEQRGISNLQAIELAERDQYILSRVGEAYVPESGDIPAKAGIAGLDTSGKVPKAQLPTDTVYTNASQELRNKTINFANNTLTGVASTTTSQELTHKTIDANSNTLLNTVTSKNITNCITAIPQDINLTLSSGTLTLKKGSKGYVPLGFEQDGTTPKFVTYTTTRDWTLSDSINGTYMACMANNGGIAAKPLTNCVSGAGATTLNGYAYNTTTNYIRGYNVNGTDMGADFAFPFCIFTVSGGAISSIDQVFNGMGYIGSTLFVLPGVKGLLPNGRNADGSLKNTEFIIGSVKTNNVTATGQRAAVINSSGNLENSDLVYWQYDEILNTYKHDSSTSLRTIIATFTATSGVISNFKPKTTFHAVDYNDWQRHIGSGEVHEITTFSDSATSGSLKWCVLDRICYVTAVITRTATGNNIVIFQSLPKPKMPCYGQGFSGRGMIFVEVGAAYLNLNCVTANATIYATLVYPVADDWVES